MVPYKFVPYKLQILRTSCENNRLVNVTCTVISIWVWAYNDFLGGLMS